MRRTSALPKPPAGQALPQTHIWLTLRTLFPYLWSYRLRVLAAMACLIGAKVANVGVPLIFKEMIDGLSGSQQLLSLPILLLVLYGVLRFSTSLFTELREILFARVTQRAVRQVSLEVFRHLHALSLRFHLERQTGGVSRDIERGSRSISSLISYTLYSILPTLVEIGLVLAILFIKYDVGYVLITVTSLIVYIVFTVKVSNWRIDIRRAVNENDSAANTRAVDSLLNYETVKYFNNEAWEARRYDEQLIKWEEAATRSQTTLAFLNLGQAAIIALGVTAMMWRAASGVVAGEMTIGDLVLVNAFLIQLYIPLNFLGIVYREIRQALTDIERMFNLLKENREIADASDARELPNGPLQINFDSVEFGYDPDRQILKNLSFAIPPGKTVAVVGHSGAGKSTLARLLYRFYDVTGGAIRINGHDLRSLQQSSLRAAIGIVPQDTVLFNDSIFYNINYGRPEASREEVFAAARAAQLHDFIESLPQKYETRVGERGLKLSGGEKQRVAIARALLKNPPILIFDEATSALDSATERAIQSQLEQVAIGHTTLIIAHRLSTVMSADEILVMSDGHIIERGTHSALLAASGNYARMWTLQQQEEPRQPGDGIQMVGTRLGEHQVSAEFDAKVGTITASNIARQHPAPQRQSIMISVMNKMKVLAVDDNRTNLHILQVFLKKLGHEVILAENGEEAVRRFESESPDLVLLDIMMPVMDGFEAARRIKAMTRDRWTPVIFLSALNRDENLVEGLDAGADDYLTKPINFVVLEAKLRSMQRSLTMQQQSIDSLRRVQAISDNVLDAIVTTNEEGMVVSVNQSTERIFGWPAAELIGQNASVLIPALQEDTDERRIRSHDSGEPLLVTTQEQEVEATHKDGHRFPATISISQVSLDNQRMIISVIRDISERKQTEQKLRENAHQLQNYYDQTQTEQQLALRLMEKQLHRSGLQDKRLSYKVIPAEHFSGDIVAAARSQDGHLYALLADATGHGLTAAISVLPVLALFYRMTKLNRSIQEIVLELNQQLKESMPVGRFVAITLVCLDESKRQGEIWVGGTPEAFLFDRWGRVASTFPSDNLPLGIVSSNELEGRPRVFTWEPESQLALCSDGLLEATNKDGDQFGSSGLIESAINSSPIERFGKIEAALKAHQNGCLASDDISLMLIECP